MSRWSFYRLSDGLFIGRRFVSTAAGKRELREHLSANTPEGCAAMEGQFDPLSQRVDLETGQVVDYVPPAPDGDHEWDAQTKRWHKRADVRARELQRARALEQIAELEGRASRPMRELWINPANEAARRRLAEIEAQIAGLRGGL
jgi:hypothetical protein